REILDDLSRVRLHVVHVLRPRKPFRISVIGNRRYFVFRRFAFRIVVHEDDAVDLARLPRALSRLRGDLLGIRDRHALAVARVTPRMKRTLNAIVDDLAADAEVRAHVRAIPVEHAHDAVLAAKRDELFAEVAHPYGLT